MIMLEARFFSSLSCSAHLVHWENVNCLTRSRGPTASQDLWRPSTESRALSPTESQLPTSLRVIACPITPQMELRLCYRFFCFLIFLFQSFDESGHISRAQIAAHCVVAVADNKRSSVRILQLQATMSLRREAKKSSICNRGQRESIWSTLVGNRGSRSNNLICVWTKKTPFVIVQRHSILDDMIAFC